MVIPDRLHSFEISLMNELNKVTLVVPLISKADSIDPKSKKCFQKECYNKLRDILIDNEIYVGSNEVYTVMGSSNMVCRNYGSEVSKGLFSHTVYLEDSSYSDNIAFIEKFKEQMVMIKDRKPRRQAELEKTIFKIKGIILFRKKPVQNAFRNFLIVLWGFFMLASMLRFFEGISILYSSYPVPPQFTHGFIAILTLLVIMGFYYNI